MFALSPILINPEITTQNSWPQDFRIFDIINTINYVHLLGRYQPNNVGNTPNQPTPTLGHTIFKIVKSWWLTIFIHLSGTTGTCVNICSNINKSCESKTLSVRFFIFLKRCGRQSSWMY
jgi:hypothetical protein